MKKSFSVGETVGRTRVQKHLNKLRGVVVSISEDNYFYGVVWDWNSDPFFDDKKFDYLKDTPIGRLPKYHTPAELRKLFEGE